MAILPHIPPVPREHPLYMAHFRANISRRLQRILVRQNRRLFRHRSSPMEKLHTTRGTLPDLQFKLPGWRDHTGEHTKYTGGASGEM